MGETSDIGDQTADLGAKLQRLLASQETLLRSQDTLLGGYNALNSTIKAIVDANAKKSFLTEDLKQDLLAALDASQMSLTEYLEQMRKTRET